MKTSRDGRVTVPRYIRTQLGFLPGTKVEWEVSDGEAVPRKTRVWEHPRGRVPVQWMRGRATSQMSTDEIMALARG